MQPPTSLSRAVAARRDVLIPLQRRQSQPKPVVHYLVVRR